MTDSAYAEAVHCLEVTEETMGATQEASMKLRAVTGLTTPPGLKDSKTNIRLDMEFGPLLPVRTAQASRHS